MNESVATDPRRSVPSDVLTDRINRVAAVLLRGFARWYLAVIAGTFGIYLGLAMLAPIAAANGVTWVTTVIMSAYRFVCHQLPYRSFSLYGYQMAFCERCTAIYGSAMIGAILFAFLPRLPKLPFKLYLALIAPMAIDGLSQLTGLRESTWELRVITGTLFGFSSMWLVLVPFRTAMIELREQLRTGSASNGAPVPGGVA